MIDERKYLNINEKNIKSGINITYDVCVNAYTYVRIQIYAIYVHRYVTTRRATRTNIITRRGTREDAIMEVDIYICIYV